MLLRNLASILSDCDAAGFHVKLKHGIVITDAGYVLPVGEIWVARTLEFTSFSDTSTEED
jgi:hypothetical protein